MKISINKLEISMFRLLALAAITATITGCAGLPQDVKANGEKPSFLELFSHGGIDNWRQAQKPGVKVGMTEQQVIEESHWGRPWRINRTTTAYGDREQWVYTNNRYLYFTNGKLTSIQY